MFKYPFYIQAILTGNKGHLIADMYPYGLNMRMSTKGNVNKKFNVLLH